MHTKDIQQATKRCFEAYESGDVEAVLDHCTDDVQYWDTLSGGVIRGKDALRPYLADLLGRFDTCYAVLEEHRLEGRDAAMVMWQCAARRRGDTSPRQKLTMQRGMNLCEFRDGLLSRTESYMDLAALERDLAPAA